MALRTQGEWCIGASRRCRRCIVFLLGVTLAAALYSRPHPVYALEPTFTYRPIGITQAEPFTVVLGDMDGDGDLDIVTDGGVVSVNSGAATFAEPRPFLGNGNVALGDMDGDGDLDIVTSSGLVNLNDGAANFPVTYQWGSSAQEIDLGDVNGDGYVDIVTSTGLIYFNEGAAAFTRTTTFATGEDRLALGDMDGNGALDIISGEGVIYFNDGAAAFPVTRRFYDTILSYGGDIALGDLDSDGDLDIVAESAHAIYQNNGDTFTEMVGFGSSDSVLVADMDNDGNLDLITTHNVDGGSYGTIRFNDGRGDFRYFDYSDNLQLYSIAVGDIDGDGDLDIVEGTDLAKAAVYLNNGSGSASWVRSQSYDDSEKFCDGIAVGDMNGDQALDIIGCDLIYRNQGAGAFLPDEGSRFGPELHITVGDMDGDHDLDIVGSSGVIYLNDGAGRWPLTRTVGVNGAPPQFMSVGDLDGDGDLDIVGHGSGAIYRNRGDANFTAEAALGLGNDWVDGVELGDLDRDGDLDLVVAGQDGVIYLNDGAGHFTFARTFGAAQHLALGDIDGDGDLDIVAANPRELDLIYRNDGAAIFTPANALSRSVNDTKALAVGDMDGDGDLDILAGRKEDDLVEPNLLYFNDGQGNFPGEYDFSALGGYTEVVAVGDMDGDGDLDIVTGGWGGNIIHFNGRYATKRYADERPHIAVTTPGVTPAANFFARAEILSARFIAIHYRLFAAEREATGRIAAFFSLDGGGSWQPAIAATNTVTVNLAAGPTGVDHTFIWDTFASGVFGQSDAVVVRLVAYPQVHPSLTTAVLAAQRVQANQLFLPLARQPFGVGAFRHINAVAGPYQWPYASAATFPFRLRGTQVRVVNSRGDPVDNALVYRLPQGAVTDADPMPSAQQPLTTTHTGYLPGRGALALRDQLMALAPITHSLNYTLYATSAAPTENGLAFQAVTQSGVQTLTVSAAHPLLLFDLDVSLEWDASQDGVFYDQLKTAFVRASALLYDASDGQIALGAVRIHSNRAAWLAADVVIYANNNLRPRATMGGLVETPVDDLQVASGKPLKAAYTPGQVRMGPIWDPFGQNFAELTQDWQRALAHELAHYLLYLPDNYLGVENGLLRITNCQGSLMTDAYNPDYSEFLTPTEWTQMPGSPCLRTVAATLLTGRSDWATIHHFYPGLQIPQNKLKGPALLPLNVTQVRVIPPATGQPPPVAARNYDLRNEAGNVTPLRQAQAYVLQGQGTETSTDDSLLYLGSTGVGSDRILVRGARSGDKVCVIDHGSEPVRAGCTAVTLQSTSIQVHAVAGWRPELQVSPITSTTFQITVTQAGEVGQLFAQLLPAYGPLENPSAIRSVTQQLTPVSGALSDTFSGAYSTKISLPYPIFEGFLRVYSAQAPEQRQAISQFFLSGGWGPPHGWIGSGANRAWGANTRSLEAPVASGDGKVTILNLDDLLADTGDTTLQAVNNLPNLPPWLTAVGAGYRIQSDHAMTRTLMFEYNQRDVPPGYEQTLNIYYLPANASAWQRLKTGPLDNGVDGDDNLATVVMPQANQGQGIDALLATVQLQPLLPGWNALTYPVGASNPVTKALASLADDYTLVYEVRPNQPGAWPLYDRTVDPLFAPLVNTLTTMTFGSNYLIYATQIVTPYLPVMGDQQMATAAAATFGGLLEPPATFYGFASSQPSTAWQAGMSLVAKIGTVTCGESRLQMWQGQLAYVIQVRADNGDGCGQVGRTVSFAIDDKPSPLSAPWDNRQTRQLLAGGKLYLPIVAR